MVVLGAGLLAGFVWWEARCSRPFIDVRMLHGNQALVRTYLRLFLVWGVGYLVIYGLSQWCR